LFSNGRYAPFGALTGATLGNGVTESWSYNNRLWQQSRTAKFGATTPYSFSVPAFAPDGDILTANDSANGNWSYNYDPLSRLLSANATGQAYTYDYDRFGNRWHQNGPRSSQLGFDANNRITGVTGVGYDAAGNLISDGSGPGTHTYFYDAENRLIQVDGTLGTCSTATACYVYNTEGQRVRKTTGGSSTDYLYDLAGHKIADVDQTGVFMQGELYAGDRHVAIYAPEPGPTGATFFTHSDWLGTERVRTDMTGASCESIASLPFGDGQSITGTCGDVSPLHFTGKERDAESGLDNFGARYNSSQLGRFMSADDTAADDHEGDPQGLNLYSYGQNNPINATDPDGHDCVFVQANSAYVASGDCTGIPNGTYVPGTVDKKSASYDQSTGTLSFSFTPYWTPPWEAPKLNFFSIGNVYGTHAGQTESEKFASRLAAGADNVNGFIVQAGLQVGAEGLGRAIGAAIGAFRAAQVARAAAEGAADLQNLPQKIIRQMGTRGWTKQGIIDTIQEAQEGGTLYSVPNKATGGAATEYVSPATGDFVVVDNSTKQVLQVSQLGYSPNHLLKP
jgi:RHS repeat-associated protein